MMIFGPNSHNKLKIGAAGGGGIIMISREGPYFFKPKFGNFVDFVPKVVYFQLYSHY